jgi:hypothetical protein
MNRGLLAALALAFGLAWAGAPALARTSKHVAAAPKHEVAAPETDGARPELNAAASDPDAPVPPSEAAVQVAAWVLASRDNGDLPYLIVDKVAAQVFAFDAGGQPLGAASILVGLAVGDDSAPGIGDKPLSAISPEERTTPAGRFVASLGVEKGNQKVLWVDYAAAVSLHAVVTANKKEHRLERLLSPDPEDHRISFGCINVPAHFFNEVVVPTFKGVRGVVYVLPDTKALDEVFPGVAAETQHAAIPVEAAAKPAADEERPIATAVDETRPAKPAADDERPVTTAADEDRPARQAANDDHPETTAGQEERPAKRAADDERPVTTAADEDRPARQAANDDHPETAAAEEERPAKRASDDERPVTTAAEEERPARRAPADEHPETTAPDPDRQ